MAAIRNVAGEARVVPWLGRVVAPDEVVQVPDADVYAYTQQAAWVPVDDAAQTAHDTAAAGQAGADQVPPQTAAPVDEPPAGGPLERNDEEQGVRS